MAIVIFKLVVYLLIPFLPLYSLLAGGYTRANQERLVVVAAILGLATAELMVGGSPVTLKLGYWLMSGGLTVEWSLLFDRLTSAMLVPIISVALVVQLYSFAYMAGDPHQTRFSAFLSLFTFAMTLLVIADNLMVLFLGWEAVGLASYLLINFWFTRLAANMAALKAFLLNRVGDLALAWGLLIAISLFSDLTTAALFGLASLVNGHLLLAISLLFILGASAKSALVFMGLHVWLPAAMEGPTPVSALIHAATMVTAGIYLFLRFAPLMEWSSTSLLLITWLGALGATLGAIGGLLENDGKKVIAYSTISQLGYMAVACGSRYYSLALFHLINHAFFKALLFLSAGAIIHALGDQQDMRKMGGLSLLLPWTYSFVLLGSLSLMAFPFMAGFYSKDLLLQLALVPYNITSAIAFYLTFAAALLTAFYSVRLLALTFIATPNLPFPHVAYMTPTTPFILIGLATLSSAFGYLALDWQLGDAMAHSQPTFHIQNLPLLTLPLAAMAIPLSYNSANHLPQNQTSIGIGIGIAPGRNGYLINYLSHWNNFNGQFSWNCQSLALMVGRYWDRGLIEIMGPLGLERLFHFLTFNLELLATGFLPHYALLLLTSSWALIIISSIIIALTLAHRSNYGLGQ